MKKALEKKLDVAFSKLIRVKETKDGYGKCVSCGALKLYSELDAGHFINRKWRPTRWLEDNVHIQCIACNRFNEGNAIGYSLYMLDRYGRGKIDYLQSLSRTRAGFTDFDGEMMLKDFRSRLDGIIKSSVKER